MSKKEQVVEGLKKCWNAFNAMEHELYADYIFDAIIYIIKDKWSVIEEDMWTSVSDGLPMVQTIYLTTDGYSFKINYYDVIKGTWSTDSEFVRWWMPIPDTPKSSNESTR